VIGLKAGATAQAEYVFPVRTDEREALRRGKTVSDAITASEVRREEIPKVDEAFCKAVGVKDAAELRDQFLQAGIEGSKKQAAEPARREKAVDALLAGLDFPLAGIRRPLRRPGPLPPVRRDAPALRRQARRARRPSATSLLAEAKKAAALRVRAQFVLSRIAEELKLEVTREELSSAIMQAAYAAQTQPESWSRTASASPRSAATPSSTRPSTPSSPADRRLRLRFRPFRAQSSSHHHVLHHS
jgi:trigger factor